MTIERHHGVDEFAPHWSATLKDGTLAVTFEIDTTLTDIPDAPLLELLRSAIATQRGEMVELRIIVSGQAHRASYSTNATIRTVIAQAIDATFNVGRKAEDWELRDADGQLIDHALTLGAALANFQHSDPFWLSPCVGWGS